MALSTRSASRSKPMVERHRGSKSKVVLIAKSSKEQDGYEGAQDTGPAPDCQPDPIWRPAPLIELAANIELEKSRTVSRVLHDFFEATPHAAGRRNTFCRAMKHATSLRSGSCGR